ncbi:uncharacterized protein [Arachis hypogaea]|uniref:uncharacterized protein n=1 Tax=Arachis hypogaea TaxID=3818 RepID=UPI003B20E9C3
MKKRAPFKWETECEEAFQHFKKVLAEPPVLAKPQTGETFYLYLSISEEALAAALIRENKKKEQKPIYFISKVLQNTETRYSRLEKLAFALLTASRRLRQYFQAHPVTIKTDQAVKQAEYEALLVGLALAKEVGAKVLEVSTDSQYLLDGTLPEDPKEGKRIKREAANYTVVAEHLYKRGFSQPLLKCVEPGDTEYILREIHEGCCGHHIGGKTLAQKIIRAGYFWPTVIRDSMQLILTRFGIPEIVILDNETQFTDRKFREFLKGLHVSHRFSSVEHHQTNGQVESANKIIVKGLKKQLDEAKGLWADELGSGLWSYRTTPQMATGETPFRLTYGVEAVILVEIGDPSPRRTVGGHDEEAERDLTNEVRSIAHIRELALKQRISLRYNHGVVRREFVPEDLVLRRNDIGAPTPGERKLTPNWEGPYRIKAVIGKGAYKLERLNGDEVPRTWNAANLRRYHT